MADHLRTELCLDALDGAAVVRGRHRFVGTVLHSDHGCLGGFRPLLSSLLKSSPRQARSTLRTKRGVHLKPPAAHPGTGAEQPAKRGDFAPRSTSGRVLRLFQD
jgi:hypothetical protein